MERQRDEGSSSTVEAWHEGLLPLEMTLCHLEVAFPLPIFLMLLARAMPVCEGKNSISTGSEQNEGRSSCNNCNFEGNTDGFEHQSKAEI